MARRHLTGYDIKVLVDIIDAWNERLTWNSLCDRAEEIFGFRPTRQTLNAHQAVKSAYDAKKKYVKNQATPSRRPSSLAYAEQKIRKLESEIERHKYEKERLIEQFIRWQYNAQKRGLTKLMLDEPLPFIDRDSSERLS
ncbi:hypothetical protein ACKC9G_07855 [Pokkaliibacter sp. CJK22405]|uniref:hypothetical protein n=1 Tax=Pokkaliibacter sp. CJK22405 TaxID=3384615 RepID=UPI0039851C09